MKESNTQLLTHKEAGSKGGSVSRRASTYLTIRCMAERAKTSKQVLAEANRYLKQRLAGVKAAVAREERAVSNKRLAEMKDLVQSIVTRTSKSQEREKAKFSLERLRVREASIKLRMEAMTTEVNSPLATRRIYQSSGPSTTIEGRACGGI